MSEPNLAEKIKQLEEIELRDQDNTKEEIYKLLLIYYLLDEQPMKAKFLWKRIPKSTRGVDKSELSSLWSLMQLLIQQKYTQFFELANIHKRWSSDELSEHFASLVDKTRERLFDLIASAYSSIDIKEMANMLGINDDEIVRVCLSREWTLDETRRYLLPKRKHTKEIVEIPNQVQMKQLTNLVSFLET